MSLSSRSYSLVNEIMVHCETKRKHCVIKHMYTINSKEESGGSRPLWLGTAGAAVQSRIARMCVPDLWEESLLTPQWQDSDRRRAVSTGSQKVGRKARHQVWWGQGIVQTLESQVVVSQKPRFRLHVAFPTEEISRCSSVRMQKALCPMTWNCLLCALNFLKVYYCNYHSNSIEFLEFKVSYDK